MTSAAGIRRDWRDTLTAATDLALLGVVVTMAAVPVVTAGAALAAASAAVNDFCANQVMPASRVTLKRFVRALLPGLGATVVGLVITALLILDASAVARGVVPGGRGLLAGTFVVGLAVLGYCGLVVVEIGRGGAVGWLAAVRRAWPAALARPWLPLALGGSVAIAVFLGLILPIVVPLLVGYLLFALHVVSRRALAS
jgi:hypothetical protein